MDFIKKHRTEDFNDIKTKLLIIKKFTKMKKIENKLKKKSRSFLDLLSYY